VTEAHLGANQESRAGALRSLATDGVWVALTFFLRFAAQAAYFLLLARALDAADYGLFVGTVVLIGFTNPLASLGSGHGSIKLAAREPGSLESNTRTAAAIAARGGLLVLLLLAVVFAFVFPRPWPLTLTLLLLLSDAIGAPLTEVCSQYYQASRRARMGSLLLLTPSVLRLLGVIAAPLLGLAFSIDSWILLYSIAGIASAVIVIGVTSTRTGLSGSVGAKRPLIEVGAPIAMIASAQMLANDADKFIVSRLSGGNGAGSYSAAYRLIDVALVPLRALLYSSYSAFFTAAAAGGVRVDNLSRRIATLSLAYAVPTAAAAWLLAPLLPLLLNESYQESVRALQILVLVLPARALQLPAADALLAVGHSGYRLRIVVAAALGNIVLNVALVPRHGWIASAWCSVITDFALVAAYWWCFRSVRKRDTSA
jgi:O-antigen/teichoic acid export membrane protein